MSRPGAILGWGLLVWAVALGEVGRSAQQAVLTPSTAKERAKVFTWFGTLGFPDVKGCKLVRVATGDWYISGDNPSRNTYLLGFVLEEKGKSFSVLTLGLTTRKFRWTPPGTSADQRVGYEKLPLAKTAVDYLQALRGGPPVEDPGLKRLRANLSARAEVFVLAWACWRHGLNREAAALYDHAAGVHDGGADVPLTPLPRAIAQDLAYTEMWRGIVAFGDPEVTRSQLLKRFQRFVRNYPDSEHAARARETVSLLKQMVREDAEHTRKRAGKPFARLSKDEQIADLIFRLRDQNAHQVFQPGSCDLFWPPNNKEDTPAHRLVRRGLDVVPRLIDALEDRRFTRSVGFERGFYFSHHVLRVGDAAEQILTRIAGRSFYARAATNAARLKESKAPTVKEQIRAWYTELHLKGEKQLLIEDTERGDNDSRSQGKRLLKKYPDVALPALIAGAKASQDEWTRSGLVELVGQVKGEGSIPFLLAELKGGPFPRGRLAAAEALHRHERPEAVAAMIAEWEGKRPPPPKGYDKEYGLAQVANFLADSGKAVGIDVLARGLNKRSGYLRLVVVLVSAFKDGHHIFLEKDKDGALQPAPRGHITKEVRAAVERLLLPALDDTEEQADMEGKWNGKRFRDPRICDLAAYALNQLDPKQYPFDLGAPLAERNRSILTLKSVLRKARGLPQRN
jgi:hypothetical protein